MSILTVLGGLVKPITEAYSSRQERKQAIHLKELEGIQNADASEFLADKARAESLQGSWKDEFITLVVTIPIVMCFVPGWNGYVTDGFNALNSTPQWFQYLTISIYSVGAGVPLAGKTVRTVQSLLDKTKK